GIEVAEVAAAEVGVLLRRHFPEGPAMAAKAAAAARDDPEPGSGDYARPPPDPGLAGRWTAFCRAYAGELKETAAAGYAPAACNHYCDLDFSSMAPVRVREARKAGHTRDRDANEHDR